MDEAGTPLAVTTAAPDRGVLAERIGGFGGPVYAAIESMNGARFVHDQLELAGWQVEIADVQEVKGLAPLACKTLLAFGYPCPVSALFGVGGRDLLARLTTLGVGWVLNYTIAAESVTSPASPTRPSWPDIPGCVCEFTSPAARTTAARSAGTDRSTCAGR